MTSVDPSHFPWLSQDGNKQTGQAVHTGIESKSSTEQPGKERKLPLQIPDLRFEQSFLLSLKPFVKPAHKLQELKTDKQEKAVEAVSLVQPMPVLPAVEDIWAGELQIDWGSVIWVTLRDQVSLSFQRRTQSEHRTVHFAFVARVSFDLQSEPL